MEWHKFLEKNVVILSIAVLIVVSIGGLVQMIPLYYSEQTIEEVPGMRPYSPLELLGRNVYVREGCYVCHSQQVRPFRDEIERYGHYSLAAESMYDHPFQWGSKRTGPDLARVGGKYSDDWHVAHMIDPRSIVPESIMPPYAFLAANQLDYWDVAEHMQTLVALGTPYTEEQIEMAIADIRNQANGETGDADALLVRYPKAAIGDFDGDPEVITELDALIAYLQILGQLIDFSEYEPATAGR